MTRSELAAWCVTVTDGEATDEREEPMTPESSLEAARSAYKARQDAEHALRDRTTELTQIIRQARESHSLAEIAQELGVSRQRIHQISEEK